MRGQKINVTGIEMEWLCRAIEEIVPRLSGDEAQQLASKLLSADCGIIEVDDLKLLDEQTLKDLNLTFLTPIVRKKLLHNWAGSSPPVTVSVAPSDMTKPASPSSMPTGVGILPDTSAMCSTPPRQACSLPSTPTSLPSPDWAHQYMLTASEVDQDVLKLLQSNIPVKPSQRTSLIRTVVGQIHRICGKPMKKDFDTVARMLVTKFPVLKEQIGDSIIGSGYDGLCRKLMIRSENLRRKQVTSKRRSEENVCNDGDKAPTDSYGCVAFHPEMEDKESLQNLRETLKSVSTAEYFSMSETIFPLQRDQIVRGCTSHELSQEYPYLFTFQGLALHFKYLTGIEEDKFSSSVNEKVPEILEYFLDMAKGREVAIIGAYKEAEGDNINMQAMALIRCLLARFGEREDSVLTLLRGTTDHLDLRKLPNTPHIICCGNGFFSADNFILAVDNCVFNCQTATFLEGLQMMFQAFYVLNIVYPQDCGALLDFIQRVFFNLNPERGTRLHSKVKTTVHPKVTTFVQNLGTYKLLN